MSAPLNTESSEWLDNLSAVAGAFDFDLNEGFFPCVGYRVVTADLAAQGLTAPLPVVFGLIL